MTDFQDIVIASAKRTAIGNPGGGLASVPAHELGAAVIKSALGEAGVAASDVHDVILGQVLTAGVGQNPARQAAIAAGLDQASTALTINQVCGSGWRAVAMGAQAICAAMLMLLLQEGRKI